MYHLDIYVDGLPAQVNSDHPAMFLYELNEGGAIAPNFFKGAIELRFRERVLKGPFEFGLGSPTTEVTP